MTGPAADAMRLLVVVDSSDGTSRTLDYLERFFADRHDVVFCLTYLLPRIPAALKESGGADGPADEERVEEALRRNQDLWMASADRKAESVLDGFTSRLCRAGVPRSAVEARATSPLDNRTAADEILVVANARHCRTIVVGRSVAAGLNRGHLAEQLVRDGGSFAIWIVD